ncbi:MAG: hypothetical protein JWL91_2507 [Sphingomonas bacterium]|nr:hypothetical protein [Sphingomonas bacterium]
MAPRTTLDVRRAAIAFLGTLGGLTAAWAGMPHLPIG